MSNDNNDLGPEGVPDLSVFQEAFKDAEAFDEANEGRAEMGTQGHSAPLTFAQMVEQLSAHLTATPDTRINVSDKSVSYDIGSGDGCVRIATGVNGGVFFSIIPPDGYPAVTLHFSANTSLHILGAIGEVLQATRYDGLDSGLNLIDAIPQL